MYQTGLEPVTSLLPKIKVGVLPSELLIHKGNSVWILCFFSESTHEVFSSLNGAEGNRTPVQNWYLYEIFTLFICSSLSSPPPSFTYSLLGNAQCLFLNLNPYQQYLRVFWCSTRLLLTSVCLRLILGLMITSSHERISYFHNPVETFTTPWHL